MTNKVRREILSELGVHNSHNLCTFGGGKIFIVYSTYRPFRPSKWSVVGVMERTDPNAPWYDYGSKSFGGQLRDGTKEIALNWATENFGVKEWARDCFGGWQDKGVLDAVYARLKTATGK